MRAPPPSPLIDTLVSLRPTNLMSSVVLPPVWCASPPERTEGTGSRETIAAEEAEGAGVKPRVPQPQQRPEHVAVVCVIRTASAAARARGGRG